MKKRYLPFTAPNWFIWLVAGLVFIFIVILGYSLYLFNAIQDRKEDGFDQSKQLVLKETTITNIQDITRYHGDIFYHVVTGKTNDGDDAIAYVPVGQEDSIKFYLANDYIGKDAILETWETRCTSCHFIGINLAIDQNQPLWEIKYIDEQDRYVFEYFSLESGESYEEFKLRKSLY
ncbi:DUF5590 domain-containing protein [Aquibacillus albus]|uniref:Uncharacterized protein YpmB n=1 Tax=Aquibacillus albus TaxID=1168171 RepID=A0ABS2MVD1_9BACI|nr:DUF5590 domain-containing protein [Aquibacillus albus]MBM7569856.1 uncharacterized protein YpmB [Aquibacillus albus]